MPHKKYKDDLNLALQKITAKEESIAQMEEISNLGSWEIDLRTGITTYSDNQYKLYGLNKDEHTPGRELLLSLLLPIYADKVEQVIAQAIQSRKISKFQVQIKRKNDGKIIDVIYSGKAVFDGDTPIKLIGSALDITEQLEVKRHSEELSNVLKYSSNEIYIIDVNTHEYLYVNQGAVDALGYTQEELLSMNIFDINPHLSQEHADAVKKEALTNTFSINRTIHQRKDGSTYHVQAYIHPIMYNNQNAFVIFDTDVSEMVHLEEQLLRQANHDILTDLPNRMLLKDRLTQALKASARNKEKFALLFIDLDKFKQINDSLGHDIGDKVLVKVSKRIRMSIRDEDTLARIGGDEFVIILRNLKKTKCSSTVCEKIIKSVREEMDIDGHLLFISASIGIAQCPEDATNESSLMKFADIAMYKAKEKGNSYIYYHDL